MNIQILSPYPLGQVPSQRFRFEQYLNLLKDHKISYNFQSFFDQKGLNVLYQEGRSWAKLCAVFRGYLRSILILFKLSNCHFVFIHREVTPIGPPVMEWIIAKILKKRIIYDFDDAIWLTDLGKENYLKIFFKNPSKVDLIIKWSWKVSCGNKYLQDHALILNKRAIINPTTVDTNYYHNQVKNQKTENVVVGWTGSHSTLIYLEPLIPLLENLHKRISFDLIVICDKPPLRMPKFARFISWNEQTEIQDLLQMNIGIMPLTEDAWAKGKCGFKAIQYMSLGIPALVSPVGVNAEIVADEINGFHCIHDEDWENALISLIENDKLRARMGVMAREKIVKNYSVDSNNQNFLSLFQV